MLNTQQTAEHFETTVSLLLTKRRYELWHLV